MLLNTSDNRSAHLNVWKYMLKIYKITKQYNYEDKVKESEKNIKKKDYNVLELDIKRTAFEVNEEESRKKLIKILKAFISSDDNIEYFQGMSYISTFLYDITKNESESYYLLLGLYLNSDLHKIFENDFLVLRKFFSILTRLLSLIIPEILAHFENNDFDVQFFVSGWFITIFTMIYQRTNKSNPKVQINIFDDFLLEGYSSIFSTILAILKYHSDKILSSRENRLTAFLINEIDKSDFFKESHLNEFIKMKEKFVIDDLFFDNLFEELNLEEKINNSLNKI